MTSPAAVAAFIAKWRSATLKERSAAQEHFIDLCRLLEVKTPAEADPQGEWYCFEKGAKKTGGGDGWADVWKRGHFGWEYKGKGKSLVEALRQLRQYAPALENPPLLIVCDLDVVEIHTNFTSAVPALHRLRLDDLAEPGQLQKLKWAFTDPDQLKPARTRQAVTEDAATLLGELAQRLRQRHSDPQAVAHFMTRLLFCLFAEDSGLLPDRLFSELLTEARAAPAEFPALAGELFRVMRQGGRFGVRRIPWFNGGLFDDDGCLPLERADLDILHSAAALDWSAIEPAIFGTLFERGLDPDKRSQLGAHYTDAESIRRLIAPVIREPLLAEWAVVKAEITARLNKTGTKARQAALDQWHGFLERLRTFRVLDPACGSGNFLYLALRTLKDIEHQAMLEAETLGLQRGFPAVGPEAVIGIEINPYAAELARLTVWIGEIQWMMGHGYSLNDQPILKPLNQIECRDALLLGESEAPWPVAEVIVGNPPFLGDKKQLAELGDVAVTQLRQAYAGRVPGGADLVCYWFEKARAQIASGQAKRAGFVATNSIRGGANRKVLEQIRKTATIFNAWSDLAWVNEGAAVRVSLVCFGNPPNPPLQKGGANAVSGGILNGQPVTEIYADLTGRFPGAQNSLDLTQANQLLENAKVSFMGITKSGHFDISGDLAREWLKQPNPHGKPNCDVLFPSVNGYDLANRLSDHWIINFGEQTDSEVALYEMPYHYALSHIKPDRLKSKTPKNRELWWRFERARPEMFTTFGRQFRYIATSMVAKHRVFVWLNRQVVPENVVIVIARSDDATFGILHSRFHELWALRLGTSLGPTPRYTPTTCFETFPFPAGLTPNLPAIATADHPRAEAIAAAARQLNELRENWLNPPQWINRTLEIIPGYPDRLIPKPEFAAELKKRTLTHLYNARPTWLVNAHRALDEAVALAYGWPVDLSDDEVLRRLLQLNQERSEK